MIDRVATTPKAPSLRRQCTLLTLSRGSLYYAPAPPSAENLRLMRRLDELYLEVPWMGCRPLAVILSGEFGVPVGRRRVARLRRIMGQRTIYREPRTSIPMAGDERYPYLLRGLKITRPNQVWATDITYIPMAKGFLYLVAIVDWYSRKILAWRLSSTLESEFCVEALCEALAVTGRKPEIFNTDQGSQFTSKLWLDALRDEGIRISMDGKGRWIDNVIIERFWRSLKYEDIYLQEYADGHALERGLTQYIERFNEWRPHQALGYKTPSEVYSAGTKESRDAAA